VIYGDSSPSKSKPRASCVNAQTARRAKASCKQGDQGKANHSSCFAEFKAGHGKRKGQARSQLDEEHPVSLTIREGSSLLYLKLALYVLCFLSAMAKAIGITIRQICLGLSFFLAVAQQ
jgi:hypothetical protein